MRRGYLKILINLQTQKNLKPCGKIWESVFSMHPYMISSVPKRVNSIWLLN